MKSIKYIAAVVMAAFTMNVSAQSFIVYGTDGSKTEFQTENVSRIEFVEGTTDPYNGHEYVDLGLPSGTLWATCNVGASVRSEHGNDYAWGETETKDRYCLENYKFYKEETESTTDADGYTTTIEYTGFTKYVTNPEFGYRDMIDNIKELELNDDAANVNWGGNWRIPTREQWVELLENCTIESVSLNNVDGKKIIGTNGNHIFIPWGLYWTSTLDQSRNADAYASNTSTVGTKFYGNPNGGYRAWEHYIRPVCTKQ